MNRSCHQCLKDFMIADEDLAFYKTISPKIGKVVIDVPPPTLCPDCRLQRRLVSGISSTCTSGLPRQPAK